MPTRADPIGFIIDHLKAVKEAAASNATVEDKEGGSGAGGSKFDKELLKKAKSMKNRSQSLDKMRRCTVAGKDGDRRHAARTRR